MNEPTPPFSLPATTPELALRLGVVMAGLVALVARRFLRMPGLMGLTGLLCGRIARAVWRFARVLTRPAKALVARPRASRAGGDRARPVSLPQRRGWLVHELGWEAAGYAGQLQALLDDPALRAILVAMPAAGRILRPLCRMLGVPGPVTAPELAIVVVETRPTASGWSDVVGLVLPGLVEDRAVITKIA